MSFRISLDERVAVVGKTGSGKSFLVKRLLKDISEQLKNLPYYHPIVILDQKGAQTFQGYGRRVRTLRQLLKDLRREEYPILVYSPIAKENTLDGADNFFEAMYELNRPMIVYVDELILATNKNKPLEYYERFMKLGRERGQTLWAGTQSPVFIPHDFFANSEHFFVFDLLLEEDRRKMAAFCGDKVKHRPEHKHGFYYYYVAERDPEYYSNELPPEYFRKDSEKDQENPLKGGDNMNTKWIVSMFILGFVLIFVLAVWKRAFEAIGEKIPAVKPVTNFVTE